jgi:hypothetical protein
MSTLTFSTPELEPYLVLAQELMRHVYAEESPEEINAWVLAQMQRLAGGREEGARLLWDESFEFYERIMAKRAADALIPESERRTLDWPWASWTKLVDPLEPGMLAVLAAGDGDGKTLYSECIAEHWASRGRQIVFLHFELNRALMLDRRTVRHTGIPRRTLLGGQLTPLQEAEREKANDRMRQWRGGITYVHTPGWTVEKALAEVRALIDQDLCDAFVVDYLEKASPSPRQLKFYAANMFAREAHDVEQIKSFAEKNEIPALLLAQLNKAGKGASFDMLDRTAIRGAGEKTEKANVVVLLRRESRESQQVQVRVDKNTVGPVGSFTQIMETPRFRVLDLTTETPPLDLPEHWSDR